VASRRSTTTSSTTARASRRERRIARSSASGAPIPLAPGRAPASGWPSSASWPRHTAGLPMRRTLRRTAPASASRPQGRRSSGASGGSRNGVLQEFAESRHLHIPAGEDHTHSLAASDRDAAGKERRQRGRSGGLEHLLHALRGEAQAAENRLVVEQDDVIEVL